MGTKSRWVKCSVTCTRALMSQVSAVSFMITFKLFTLLWPSELSWQLLSVLTEKQTLADVLYKKTADKRHIEITIELKIGLNNFVTVFFSHWGHQVQTLHLSICLHNPRSFFPWIYSPRKCLLSKLRRLWLSQLFLPASTIWIQYELPPLLTSRFTFSHNLCRRLGVMAPVGNI